MEASLQLVVHGRGNAWPVPLGETHPFYHMDDPRDLSNAAFSLLATDGDRMIADLLIDAGHGTVQSLIAGSNRIPDAICLTHGHMDHTLGVDWVVQSFWRRYDKQKQYPVYATDPVYRFLLNSYPHLEQMMEHRELKPGVAVQLGSNNQISLTAYPVYHGKGAVGACMLLFEIPEKRVLFTGDLLSPLIRHEDYQNLQELDLMVVDTNNRFPWPRTNHWSFAGHPENPLERSKVLLEFSGSINWDEMIGPQIPSGSGKQAPFFSQLRKERSVTHQAFTILEFLQQTEPARIMLVHYSGAEDWKYYTEPQLPADALLEWVKDTLRASHLKCEPMIPEAGQVMDV